MRIHEPRREKKGTGDWTESDDDELNDLYCTPNACVGRVIERGVRTVEHVTRLEQKRSLWKLLVGKREGKRPLGRPKCR